MIAEYDVVVVGGGVVGALTALRLVNSKYRVALIESNVIGGEASRAAIGGLTPQSDEFTKGDLRYYALRSVEKFPALLEELKALTGAEVEYQDKGLLQVALTENELHKLSLLADSWNADGFVCRKLDRYEILELEPMLTSEVVGGYHLPGEHQVDTAHLMDALAQALNLSECAVLLDTTVLEVLHSGGSVCGVILDDASFIAADWVVIAAGAWSGRIRGLPPCPMEPMKGQALSVEIKPQQFTHHIYNSPIYLDEEELTSSAYIVPRNNGQILLGVTYELVNYDKSITLDGIRMVIEACTRLAPLLRNGKFIRAWSGLRPKTIDNKPIIGKSSYSSHLIFATGHFGLGITLAPITAEIVSNLITEAENYPELIVYSPDRFLK